MKNVKKETIIRTIISALALLNSVLVMAGKPIVNIGDETIEQGVNIVATVLTTVWVWWKNNSFTQSAIQSDEYLSELKKKGV